MYSPRDISYNPGYNSQVQDASKMERDPNLNDNENDGEGGERKSYRKYVRPDYKPSQVSRLTDARWRKLFRERRNNPLAAPGLLREDPEGFLEVGSDSSHDSEPMSVEQNSPEGSLSASSISSVITRSEGEVERFPDEDEFNSSHSSEDSSSEQSNNERGEDSEDEVHEELNNENQDDEELDSDSSQADDRRQYPWENRIIFDKSGLTVRDVVGMIRGIALRFGFTKEARMAVVNLIKLCAGPEFERLNLTNYVISKMFDAPDDKITFCFYCPACKKVLECVHEKKGSNPEGLCDVCGTKCYLYTRKGKYFLTVDLKYQIERLFQQADVKTALLAFHQRQRDNDIGIINKMRDVQDGILYKKLNPTNCNTVLTFNFFLDGAALRRSGTESFWSILVHLNELPVSIRFKYIMLAGLMITEKEPKPDLMNSFLEKFNEQVMALSTEGLELKVGRNIRIRFTFRPLCAIADSVARPILQNRLQYNAYYSCSWCYQFGFYSKCIRFPFDPDFRYRSHETHLRDVYDTLLRQANLTNSRKLRETFVRGVKGFSALLNLEIFFDMIWSFPFEYMHAILLGVVEQLWDAWVKMGLLSAKNIDNINRLLSSFKPVFENHRLPRWFSAKSKWKASEWRSWLLFFSVPCLKDYLPAENLRHFCLLVNTVYTLLKTEITEDDLQRCECNMVQFVGEFGILYGVDGMTFNVHTLLHVVESVRQSGPLCYNSAFPFESHLFVLKQYVTGTKKPEQQMANKALNILQYKYVVSNTVFHSEIAKQYCESIFSHKLLSTYVTGSTYGVAFFGRSEDVEINNPTNNISIFGESFKKCVYRGCVYKSMKNTISTRRNDTIVKLKSGQVVQIGDIIKTDLTCYFSTKELIVVQEPLVTHMYQVIKKENNIIVVSIDDVEEKLIYLECGTIAAYVCHLPQTVEVQ